MMAARVPVLPRPLKQLMAIVSPRLIVSVARDAI